MCRLGCVGAAANGGGRGYSQGREAAHRALSEDYRSEKFIVSGGVFVVEPGDIGTWGACAFRPGCRADWAGNQGSGMPEQDDIYEAYSLGLREAWHEHDCWGITSLHRALLSVSYRLIVRPVRAM